MKVILFGATSTIAREIARQLAEKGDTFLLAARDVEQAKLDARDLEIRTGAAAIVERFDALDFASHETWVSSAQQKLGGIDGVIICFGYLGEQTKAQTDPDEAARIIDVNFKAVVSVLEPVARILERQRRGYILGLSSVAGERGRKSNYVYGSSKAAMTVYLQGLSHRLAASGVDVKIAKLGFVESKMTRGMPMPGPLRSSPQRAAKGVITLLKSKSESAFVPWIWWPVMTIIKALPPSIFRKSNL